LLLVAVVAEHVTLDQEQVALTAVQEVVLVV